MMFDYRHYVPVLKWKRGEQRALEELAAEYKAHMTPLIELAPLPISIETGEPSREGDEHLDDSLESIVRAWGTSRELFLDPSALIESVEDEDLTGRILEEAEERGLLFIPVIRLTTADGALETALEHNQRGICLRLTLEDLEELDLSSGVEEFLRVHGLNPRQIHVNLDLESVYDMAGAAVRATSRDFLRSLPHLEDWWTVTLTASSFPQTMAGIPEAADHRLPRTEWLTWRWLVSRPAVDRAPTFGDYGIQYPEWLDFDPRYMNPAATIRYTLEEEWCLVKGRSFRDKGGTQFRRLASTLTRSDAFLGINHCAGCSQIDRTGRGEAKVGNLETWRRIGTNHHLTLTIEQLRRLP